MVEGEPVRGDPAGEVHAHLDPVVRADADHPLLERADVLPDVGPVGEIDDRVADDLARAVVGDVAAPVGLVQLEPVAREPLRRGDDVTAVRAPADGEHRRVLHEEEVVGGGRAPRPHRLAGDPHEVEAVGVLDAPEPVDDEGAAAHARAALPASALRGRSGRLSAWIASPSAALHASLNASGSVGCAWTVSATSSR